MKSMFLMISVMLSISLIFSVHNVNAQVNTETWSLGMDNSYKIPINTENVILGYIRAETNNNKILMYIEVENSAKSGSIQFVFPTDAVSEIFNNPICSVDATQEFSEFLVYVNQNMYETIYADVVDSNDTITLNVTLPSDSGVVEIFSLCSTVLQADDDNDAVSENSTNITVDYESVKDLGRMMPIDYYWYLPYMHWIYGGVIAGITAVVVFVIIRRKRK